MPETGEQPAKPVRTWRPMILWSAGIALVLGLAWFAGLVVVPVWQTREAVVGFHQDLLGSEDKAIAAMGGPREATRKLALYVRLPEKIAPWRQSAAVLLGRCGPSAVPALVELLDDRNGWVRRVAVRELRKLRDERAAPVLLRALKSEDSYIRMEASVALGDLRSEHAATVLEPLLSDEDLEVRVASAVALWKITEKTDKVLPVLVAAMRSSLLPVRLRAASALAEMGAAASPAIPQLQEMLRSEDFFVREDAASALKKIQDEEPPK